MSEVIEKRLRESLGKAIKVILKNGYIWDGTISGVDSKYLELVLDFHRGYKIVMLQDIAEIKIKEERE